MPWITPNATFADRPKAEQQQHHRIQRHLGDRVEASDQGLGHVAGEAPQTQHEAQARSPSTAEITNAIPKASIVAQTCGQMKPPRSNPAA